MNDPKPAVPATPGKHVPHIPPAELSAARRVVHFRVPADMILYAALAGKTPDIDPTLADPMKAVIVARREHPWSPTVLSQYLRQICREKALKINKPELAGWLLKQSATARKTLWRNQGPHQRGTVGPGGLKTANVQRSTFNVQLSKYIRCAFSAFES